MKTPKQKLRDKADKLWSQAIFKKIGGKCEKCGKSEGLAAHHIFSRRYSKTRYNLENSLLLCIQHHLYYAHAKGIKETISYAQWVVDYKGKDTFDILDRLSEEYHKPDYNMEILKLTAYLKSR